MEVLRIIDLAGVGAMLAVFVSLGAWAWQVRAQRLTHLAQYFHDIYVFRKVRLRGDRREYTLAEIRSMLYEGRSKPGEPLHERITRVAKENVLPGTKDYQCVHELSHALEQLGALVMAGAIPLKFVLAHRAPRIIIDYLACQPVIEQERERFQIALSGRPSLLCQFRHGEWLAGAALTYMVVHWRVSRVETWAALLQRQPWYAMRVLQGCGSEQVSYWVRIQLRHWTHKARGRWQSFAKCGESKAW